MKQSEIIKMLGEHTQKIREEFYSNGEQPSKNTLAEWRLEDQTRAMLIRHYEALEAAEAEEPVNVNIKSEVRVRR